MQLTFLLTKLHCNHIVSNVNVIRRGLRRSLLTFGFRPKVALYFRWHSRYRPNVLLILQDFVSVPTCLVLPQGLGIYFFACLPISEYVPALCKLIRSLKIQHWCEIGKFFVAVAYIQFRLANVEISLQIIAEFGRITNRNLNDFYTALDLHISKMQSVFSSVGGKRTSSMKQMLDTLADCQVHYCWILSVV